MGLLAAGMAAMMRGRFAGHTIRLGARVVTGMDLGSRSVRSRFMTAPSLAAATFALTAEIRGAQSGDEHNDRDGNGTETTHATPS